MRRARTALIGLGLLLATLPATALADKDNTAKVGVSAFTFSCSHSGKSTSYSFDVTNLGDADGTFAMRLRVDIFPDDKSGQEHHDYDLGTVALEAHETKSFSGSNPTVAAGHIGRAQVFVHRANRQHLKTKKEKAAEKAREVCA